MMKEIIFNVFYTISHTFWLEWVSVICGIIQVLLSKKNKVSNYFYGILGILSGMFVLYTSGLYGEIVLQVYYLVMSVYGWWYWTSNKAANQQSITTCSKTDWSIVIAIVVFGFFFFFIWLSMATDSDVPIYDAWVSSTAWAGMWLLAKRKLENWILLNISNVFAVPLLIYKDLYLFAGLTVFLTIVAVFGYLNWRKILHNPNNDAY